MKQRDADDERARVADHVREAAREGAADRASLVAAERDHEPERADGETRPEGLQVDDLAADEHQPADADEHDRDRVGGDAEGAVEPVADARARPARRPSRARAPSRGSNRPPPSRVPTTRDGDAIGS